MKKKCIICGYKKITLKVSEPLFRHMDYKKIFNSGRFAKCIGCQVVSNLNKNLKELNKYKTLEYAKSQQTDNFIFEKSKNKKIKKTLIQARLINNYISKKQNMNVLDIGCFDGSLLKDLSRFKNFKKFYGYDVSNHFRKELEDNNIFLFKSSFKSINKKFDLIIFSHSFSLLKNLNFVIKQLSCLLKKNGTIYIQIPDIEKNPFYILLGDQNYILTKKSIQNLFLHNGFNVKVLKNNYFNRDIIFLIKKHNNKDLNKTKLFIKDFSFENAIKKIQAKKIKILKKIKRPSTILGTTITSAYFDEIINSKISFFLDENENKLGKYFRNKKILHPREIDKNYNVILPFGNDNFNISRKYRNNYKGKLILI